VGNVFDPFMGSGTTAICCEILKKQGHNIKWIGIEMEQKWVDKANERLKEVQDGFVF
jgi:site-specific DNA-methyltransferase (adenine-specific)